MTIFRSFCGSFWSFWTRFGAVFKVIFELFLELLFCFLGTIFEFSCGGFGSFLGQFLGFL